MQRFRYIKERLSVFIGGHPFFDARSDNDLVAIYGRLRVNAHTIVRPFLGLPLELGIGLYLGVSKIDHNCHANAAWVVREDLQNYVVALRDIDDFRDVRCCYVDRFKTIAERQAVFREEYFFTCTCGLCRLDGDDKSVRGPY